MSFNLPAPLSGTLSSARSIGFGDLLSHLNFATMVTADARYDRFSAVTDFIYFNLGGTGAQFGSNNAPGVLPVPISGSLQPSEGMNVNAEYWTLAGGYTLAKGDWGNIDLIGGFRFIEINSRVNYSLGLTLIGPDGRQGAFAGIGSVSTSGSVCNGIGGIRSGIRLGDTGLFVPYYFDAGPAVRTSPGRYHLASATTPASPICRSLTEIRPGSRATASACGACRSMARYSWRIFPSRTLADSQRRQ